MSGEMVRPTPGRDDAAAAVESLVLRGDLSALGPAHRAAYYLRLCEQLGLNPHAQPFAFLRLNGKEVLYATRGATDQLAAIHRLNREIIDGPKVIDLAGTKLVIAVCRATHPNGRVETATATVPLTDPVNVLMKAETKAKRRATLSILGLGLLDEMELETIPGSAQEPGGGVNFEHMQGMSVPEGKEVLLELARRADGHWGVRSAGASIRWRGHWLAESHGQVSLAVDGQQMVRQFTHLVLAAHGQPRPTPRHVVVVDASVNPKDWPKGLSWRPPIAEPRGA